MVAIDWLSVRQMAGAGEQFPVYGSREVFGADMATGEVTRLYVQGEQQRGSWASSVVVASDRHRIYVSGNPSRWHRRDALFGLDSVPDGAALWSELAQSLGLPAFRYGEDVEHVGRVIPQTSENPLSFRATLTRVDLCENVAVGRGNVAEYLRVLQAQTLRGRAGHLYGDGGTCDWNRGSRRVYLKCYDKARELRRQMKAQPDDESKAHLSKLIEWCDSEGVARWEVTLKSMALRSRGLDSVTAWGAETAREIMNDYRLDKRIASDGVEDAGIVEFLVRQWGEDDRKRAQRANLVYHAWRQGVDVRGGMSRAQWYRHRQALLLVGIDIGSSPGVAALPVTVRHVSACEVSPPAWYARAAA